MNDFDSGFGVQYLVLIRAETERMCLRISGGNGFLPFG
jgi:hypothetical protein